ncbi:MAG: translocation/assembly module TamB domain-containing protein [Bacteroidales bacterium]
MEGKDIKKTRKIVLWVFAVLVLLPAIFYGLLHSPYVQTYLVGHLTNYLSRELDTEIRVGSVDISLFRTVILEDVSVMDRDGESLFVMDYLKGDLNRISVRRRQLSLSRLEIDGAFGTVYKNEGEDDYNYQFLVDYFSNELLRGPGWDVSLAALTLHDITFRHQNPNASPVPNNAFDPADFCIEDLHLAVENIRQSGDLLEFEMENMRYRESRGFKMEYMSGQFAIGSGSFAVDHFALRTPDSELAFELVLEHDGSESFRDLLAGKGFNLIMEPSRLDMRDVAHYFPTFYGADQQLFLSGEISGEADSLTGRDVLATYGDAASFRGSFNMDVLSEWPHLQMDVRVEELSGIPAAINEISFPESLGFNLPQLPDFLVRADQFAFSGLVIGDLAGFEADGTLQTNAGSIYADVLFQRDDPEQPYRYEGMAEGEGVHTGVLLDNQELPGPMDLYARFSGSGLSLETADLVFDGKVIAMDFRDYTYQDISFSGDLVREKLNTAVSVTDPYLELDLSGMVDLAPAVPEMDFQVAFDRANLTRLNIYQRDSLYESVLTAGLEVDSRFGSLDLMEGEVLINNIRYREEPVFSEHFPQRADPRVYRTGDIYLSSAMWTSDNSHLRIRSDFLDADMYGKIHFEHLGRSLRHFTDVFLPSLEAGKGMAALPDSLSSDLNFSVRFNHTELLSALFFPWMEISPEAWITGRYDASAQTMKLDAQADMLTLGGRHFTDWELNGERADESFLLQSTSRRLMLSDSIHMNNFSFDTAFCRDSIMLDMSWRSDNNGQDNHGQLRGTGWIYDPLYKEFNFYDSYASIDGDVWRIAPENQLIVDSARIETRRMRFYHDNQYIEAGGVLSADPDDRMTLSFSGFDLAYTDLLMGGGKHDFDGMLNGFVSFTALYQPVRIGTELHVEDFTFNREWLGNFDLQSVWSNEEGAFEVEGAIIDRENESIHKPLVMTGRVYTGDRDDNLDLNLDLTDMTMSIWEPYLGNFAENFHGQASGELHLGGQLSGPELSGRIDLKDTGLYIPYLNTSYHFSHEVEFGKDYFRFENLVLQDTLGNTGLATGSFKHQNFSDFSLDVRLQPEQMIIFDTGPRENAFYYGTGFLTGVVHLHGPVSLITMDITGRTNRGTRVFLPLNYAGEVRESHFISFVSEEEPLEESATRMPERPGGVALNFDLEVTPEAEVELLFDARFGDIIRGRGSGDLKLEVAPGGTFNIYGDYVIEDGEYLFTLQNIINKRFRIEQGSTIGWTGDLNNADMDIRAAYRLRTPLYDLVRGEGVDPDIADRYRRRIPVETIMVLEDKLFNPAISFDIEIPGGDEGTREMIDRMITTDQEMNRQVFSLLVLNRFLPTTADQYNTALGYGVGNTSSELLSNQLSNWLSQISSDFDIGINYRPGDEISGQEVELALSTQFFDDRVIVDGNFGVAGNETATGYAARGTNQIIGDVNVEVKITPEGKFRVKAFNRSNTFDIIHNNAPYTQGVGLFYRREFDGLGDLFHRDKKPEEFVFPVTTTPAPATEASGSSNEPGEDN